MDASQLVLSNGIVFARRWWTLAVLPILAVVASKSKVAFRRLASLGDLSIVRLEVRGRFQGHQHQFHSILKMKH